MSFIKANIAAMAPYSPPLDGRDAAKDLLLDFNERTVPVSQSIKQALLDYLASDVLQQYPHYGDIAARLAEYAGVKTEQVMITNGSDQGIDLVFRAANRVGAEAIIPAPTFAMYGQCAKVEAMKIHQPQYNKSNGYPLDEVLSAINECTAVIVVSNPNNPCGTAVDNSVIHRLAQAAPNAAILVDECYYEYTHQSVVNDLPRLPNVVVTRTFSKTWGIPSLRFGYLMAAPEVINALCNVRGPYDINQMAVVAANAALDNRHEITAYSEEVMQKAKPRLEAWLSEQGLEFWHSSANYLWVFPDQPQALNDYLQSKNILVRPKALGDRLGLRVTIGTLPQVERLIQVWSEFSS